MFGQLNLTAFGRLTMGCAKPFLVFVLLLQWISLAVAQGDAPAVARDRGFFLSQTRVTAAKSRIKAGDPELLPIYHQLLREAETALQSGPFSVMQKLKIPPSGDKHDYMSIGPYWWPDPNKADGLPYIRRDGEVNPEYRTADFDSESLGNMSDAVSTLALAYYFSDRPEFADHAAAFASCLVSRRSNQNESKS